MRLTRRPCTARHVGARTRVLTVALGLAVLGAGVTPALAGGDVAPPDLADLPVVAHEMEPLEVPTGYTPVTPTRVLDTRDGTGGAKGALGAGRTLTATIPATVVPPSASAVVLNVTAVAPTLGGYLTVWPAGNPRPSTSNLNLIAGGVVANSVVVELGSTSTGVGFSLYNAVGAVYLVADVAGYLAAGSGDALVPTPPIRVLDTRDGTGSVPAKVRAGETRRVRMPDWVPAEATGVVLNLTGVNATDGTFLTAWGGGTRPLASNLNLVPGRTVPNLVVTALTNRSFSLYNDRGTADAVADISGYLLPGAEGTFVPQAPGRVVDTRTGTGVGKARIGAGGSVTLTVADPDAGAVALNVTAVGASDTGFLTVWPAGTVRPLASSLNVAPGSTVPNAVVVQTTNGQVQVYNHSGSVDLVVDMLAVWRGAVPSPVAPAPVPGPSPAAQPAPGPAQPTVQGPAPTNAGSASQYKVNRHTDGSVIRWNPCSPVEYRVNLDHAPPGALADVQATFDSISDASGIPFRYLGTTTRIPQKSWMSTWPSGEAQFVISWGRPTGQAGGSDFLPGGNVIGMGGWLARGGGGKALQIANGLVILDANYTTLGAGFGDRGRGQVLLHEIGHSVGLGHADENVQIMFGSVSYKAGGYGAGDVSGLQAVGAPQGCL